jgi:hypothetical protein
MLSEKIVTDIIFHRIGDLNISVSVLYNYLEANAKVPWASFIDIELELNLNF